MIPGILMMTLFGVSIDRVLRGGDWGGIALVALSIGALACVGWKLQRWLGATPSPGEAALPGE
jgi:hypothetical protein